MADLRPSPFAAWRGDMADELPTAAERDPGRTPVAAAPGGAGTAARVAGAMAHELNNILTMIGANIELARTGTADGPAREALDRALDAVTLGAIALRNYRAVAGESKAFVPSPLMQPSDEILRTAALLRRVLGQSVAIDVAVPSDLWPVALEPGALEAAIVALVRNGCDAMPSGARLLITGRNVSPPPVPNQGSDTHTGQEDLGGTVRIDVRDEGAGMTGVVRLHATEPFFTTRPPGRSAGLGLTSVLASVRRAGGSLEIQSEPGRGTTVSLLLPRAAPPAVAQGEDRRHRRGAEVPLGDGETVLIVSADEVVTAALADQIESLGYVAVTAREAQEACCLAQSGADIVVALFGDTDPESARAGVAALRGVRSDLGLVGVILSHDHPVEIDRSSLSEHGIATWRGRIERGLLGGLLNDLVEWRRSPRGDEPRP
jgi:hypothetical protein